MTFEEFKTYLETNGGDDEVNNLLNSTVLTRDNVGGYLESDDGKKLLQPKLDSYHAKSLDSWKSNNLDELVQTELAKLNPEKSEAEKQVEQLRKEIEEERAKSRRQELLGDTTKSLADEGLPTKLVELLIADDEEVLTGNIESYKELVETVKQQAIAEFTKRNGREFKQGGGGGGSSDDDKVKNLVAGIYGEGNQTDQTKKAQQAFFKSE